MYFDHVQASKVKMQACERTGSHGGQVVHRIRCKVGQAVCKLAALYEIRLVEWDRKYSACFYISWTFSSASFGPR